MQAKILAFGYIKKRDGKIVERRTYVNFKEEAVKQLPLKEFGGQDGNF